MRRNVLFVAVTVVAVVAAGAAGTALGGQQPTADAGSGQTITVAGDGSASTQPDQAVVVVAVVTEGDDPAAVRDRLANGTADLRAALREAGVPEDAVTTAEYRLRGTPPHRERENPDAPAYTGVHAFEVTVSDTDRAGAVVDAAADAGAEVRHLRFTLAEDTRERLRDEALRGAVSDARGQAETLADAGDLSVTGVHSIDATDRNFQPVRYETAAAGGDAGTSIETGDVTVSTTVRVVFNATG